MEVTGGPVVGAGENAVEEGHLPSELAGAAGMVVLCDWVVVGGRKERGRGCRGGIEVVDHAGDEPNEADELSRQRAAEVIQLAWVVMALIGVSCS